MTLIYSPRQTDCLYPLLAREAFCLADVFLRKDGSPFQGEFLSESNLLKISSFDRAIRIVEDLRDKQPFEFYSNPHSASIQDRLSEEEKFGKRRPVWDILQKAFSEITKDLFPDTEVGRHVLYWIKACHISNKYKDLEKAFLEQLRKEFGIQSIKVFASASFESQGLKFPKATSLGKNFICERELEQFTDFVALSAMRLDAHFHNEGKI